MKLLRKSLFLSVITVLVFVVSGVRSNADPPPPPPPKCTDSNCKCPPPPPCDSCPTASTGSTLNLLEGAMEDDYNVCTLQSRQGPTVRLTLAYSSFQAVKEASTAANTCLGFGWTHSYNVFLYTYQGWMFRRDHVGRISKFIRVPLSNPVRYNPAEGYFETLVRNPDGTFSLGFPDGRSQKFQMLSPCPYVFASPIYQMIEQKDRNGNKTTLLYDAAGRLWKIRDPYSREIIFTYDTWNRVATITDPLSRVTRFVHGAAGGQLLQIIDPAGNTNSYTYNNTFQVVQKVKPNGDAFLYTYGNNIRTAEYLNTNGVRTLLASVFNPKNWAFDQTVLTRDFKAEYLPSWITNTDGRGNCWIYANNKYGSSATNLVPGQTSVATAAYSPATLKRTAATDANGGTTLYAYDAKGNLLAETNALGQVTRYTYEPVFNQVTSITDPNGFVTTYLYDARGNQIKETDPLGFTREWTYDAHGNVLAEKDKNGNWTAYAYDAFGNRVQTTDPLGKITTLAYDAVGNLLSRTDANSHTTWYGYDALDRLVAQTNALDGVTLSSYDAEGNRTQVVDANGNTNRFAYDFRKRLVKTTDPLGQVTADAYDGNGNRIAETNVLGFVTRFGYDAQNRLVRTTNALGCVTSIAYDAVGNKLSATDANGHVTTFAYDCLNRLIRSTDALGGIIHYEYDAGPGGGGCGCGSGTKGTSHIIKQTDANGKVTYFKYCPLGRLLKQIRKQGDTADLIDADDAVTTYFYDPNGNRLAVTEPNGNSSWFGYDLLNRQVASTNAAGDLAFATYDPAGNLRTATAPNGNVTVNTYDAANRLVQVDDSLFRVANYAYDAVGNPVTSADGLGNATQYAYDALNRVIRTTDPMGSVSTNVYDPLGKIMRSIDRNGNATGYTYDALNRRIAVTNALGYVTTFAYDCVGNLVCLTDSNSHSTCYEYDARNHLLKEIYPDLPGPGEPPDSNKRFYTYDGVGNRLSRTDQMGRTTLYHYSDLYYLTARSYASDPSDNFTYDLSGRMLTAEKGGWLDTFAYDGANRVINTTQGGRVVAYAYNIPGRTRTITYPGGRAIAEQTDYRNRLVAIDDGASPPPIAQQTYDLGNRLLHRAYRNGTVATYGYNANGWITTLDHTLGIARIAGFAYDYDKEGNKKYEAKLHDTTDSEAYQYDATYRLLDYKVGTLSGGGIPSPSLEKAYNLDPVGNWNSVTATVVPGGTTVETRSHNAANELTARNGLSFTYDANGNLTQDDLFNYAYDEENRLSAVTRRSDALVVGQYGYDALSRRVIKIANPAGTPTQSRFFYDGNGWRVLEELDAAGFTQASYVYGNYLKETLTMDRGGQTYYYHQQILWSPVALTDAGGAPVERYAYDAYGWVKVCDGAGTAAPATSWGTPHSPVANSHLFTGQELEEETGLFYFGYRVYSPALGRWLSRDPIDVAGGLNLYGFVRNAPVTATDPLGLETLDFTIPGHNGLYKFAGKWVWSCVEGNESSSVDPNPGLTGWTGVGGGAEISAGGVKIGIGVWASASTSNDSTWEECLAEDGCPGKRYKVDLHAYLYKNASLLITYSELVDETSFVKNCPCHRIH